MRDYLPENAEYFDRRFNDYIWNCSTLRRWKLLTDVEQSFHCPECGTGCFGIRVCHFSQSPFNSDCIDGDRSCDSCRICVCRTEIFSAVSWGSLRLLFLPFRRFPRVWRCALRIDRQKVIKKKEKKKWCTSCRAR